MDACDCMLALLCYKETRTEYKIHAMSNPNLFDLLFLNDLTNWKWRNPHYPRLLTKQKLEKIFSSESLHKEKSLFRDGPCFIQFVSL